MMSSDRRPAVIHLVWGPLGADSLRAFLRSYHDHDAGIPHELVVVFNGVQDTAGPPRRAQRAALLAELEQTPHRLIELDRPALDLVAYRQVAAMLDHPHVCVLNSHSRIRAEGWLVALEGALRSPGVGLAAASGSWASMRSYARYHLGLPSAYRRVWPDRAATLRGFQALAVESTDAREPRGLVRRLQTTKALLDMTVGFSSFPAPHIRTNAFMAERELLSRMLSAGVRRKVDAHRLESGTHGLTRRIEQAGQRALVVDRSGRQFEVEDWPESDTFWQGEQRALLVSDNQTESYEHADAERRRLLSTYAWGERAAPSPTAS